MTSESGYAGCCNGVNERTSRRDNADNTIFLLPSRLAGACRRVGRSLAAKTRFLVGVFKGNKRSGWVPRDTIFLSFGGDECGREYVVSVPSREPMRRVGVGRRSVKTMLRAGAESGVSIWMILSSLGEIN